MKKLLSVLVAALMLGTLAVSANAAELQNYCKDGHIVASTTDGANVVIDGDGATVWSSATADEESITLDLGGIKPIGYIEITFGDRIPADFTVNWTSNADDTGITGANQTITGNTDKTVVIEGEFSTQRTLKFTFTKSNGDGYDVAEIVVRKSKDSVDMVAGAYPSSGTTAPDGSKIIMPVELIGSETGWGGNADTGRDKAFDGDINTFFDPQGVGDGFAGIDAGKEYVVTKIAIHPRDGQLPRFYGATIQGSNDMEEWTDIWMSVDEATEWTWYEMDESEFDETGVGYRYFRYFNMLSHGDVADVELYGYPVDGVWDEAAAPAEEPAPAETEPEVVETEPEVVEPAAEPAVEEPAETVETPAAPAAPQTFDMGIIAAAAAAVSALGFAVSKKKR